jgi:hypothetical protein
MGASGGRDAPIVASPVNTPGCACRRLPGLVADNPASLRPLSMHKIGTRVTDYIDVINLPILCIQQGL